jgi:hypothetical protein
MRNVTFSADSSLIEKARERARRERKTLNSVFRDWLELYTSDAGTGERFDRLMRSLAHVRFARKFTREGMNTR